MTNSKKRDEITCVQLSKLTRDKLAEMGKKSDTFEDIITNLMEKSGSQNPEVEDKSEEYD